MRHVPLCIPCTCMQAWENGLYSVLGGTQDDPQFTNATDYEAPTPTLSIENIVPEIYPSLGSTLMGIS